MEPSRLEELIEPHRTILHNYVLRHVGRDLLRLEPASDIVQSTLREVLTHSGGFVYRGEQALRAYLIAAVDHKIANKRRFWQSQRRAGGEVQSGATLDANACSSHTAPTPSAIVQHKEELERLRGAMEGLPEEDLRILKMHYFDKAPSTEIAQVLGIDEATVRRRLVRVTARLGQQLGSGGVHDGE
jgi:RNA polymerase sigma-70 factor (ECF subfamily)